MEGIGEIVGIVLVLAGLAYCFAGFWIFEFLLRAAGFILGAIVGLGISSIGDAQGIEVLLFVGSGGLVGMGVLVFLHNLAIFALGAVPGGLLGWAISIWAGWDPGLLATVLAIAGGVLAIWLHVVLLKITTAIVGAFAAMQGVMMAQGRLAFFEYIEDPDLVWIPVLLALVGMIVQFGAARAMLPRASARAPEAATLDGGPPAIAMRSPPPVEQRTAAKPPTLPPPPAGPRGRMRPPGVAVVLSILTLGVYHAIWTVQVSGEMDRFAPTRPRARPLAFTGVGLFWGGVAGALAVSTIAIGRAASGDPRDVVALLVASLVAAFLGGILYIVALWRVWSGIRIEEIRRGDPIPISPGAMVALTTIPYVQLVGGFIALHRTQRGLNAIWESTSTSKVQPQEATA